MGKKTNNNKCSNCGKHISFSSKKCKSCDKKYHYKIYPSPRGKKHWNYNRKNTSQGKKIMGSRNGNFGKNRKLKNKIITHHIDLNYFNNKKDNILKITLKKHTSLHHRAYDYLVKIDKIKQYIKWFLKTDKGNKIRSRRGRGYYGN